MPTLNAKHTTSMNLGLQLRKSPEAKAEPNIWPKYTALPRTPNLKLFNYSSSFILTEPAGNIPISILMNKFAKNYNHINIFITLGLISEAQFL